MPKTSVFQISVWEYQFASFVFQNLKLAPQNKQIDNRNTACWYDFNSKQLSFEKFLQNPFLGCLWSPWTVKIILSAVEAFYLMI